MSAADALSFDVAWKSVLGGALLFGMMPTFVLRLALLIYPRRDRRRLEHLAEIEHVPFRERPVWVASLIPTILFDGLPGRARSIAEALRDRPDDPVREFLALLAVTMTPTLLFIAFNEQIAAWVLPRLLLIAWVAVSLVPPCALVVAIVGWVRRQRIGGSRQRLRRRA